MDATVPTDRIGVLEELLNERYSVRAFLPQEVPRETIEHILSVSQRTASWCNSQPWQVLIASGEAKEKFRKAIYAEAASGAKDDHDFTPPREYLGVYLERRRESGFQLYNTLGIARGDKMAYAKQALENYNFFGAPHVAIIHTDEPLGIYGAVDCGAYVGNFMLAAQALGLGTIPQAALARHSGLIRRHFKLADDRKVVCGISFGFADHAHKVNSYRTSRASVADTVTVFVRLDAGNKKNKRSALNRTSRGLTRASIGFKAGCHLFDGLQDHPRSGRGQAPGNDEMEKRKASNEIWTRKALHRAAAGSPIAHRLPRTRPADHGRHQRRRRRILPRQQCRGGLERLCQLPQEPRRAARQCQCPRRPFPAQYGRADAEQSGQAVTRRPS